MEALVRRQTTRHKRLGRGKGRASFQAEEGEHEDVSSTASLCSVMRKVTHDLTDHIEHGQDDQASSGECDTSHRKCRSGRQVSPQHSVCKLDVVHRDGLCIEPVREQAKHADEAARSTATK